MMELWPESQSQSPLYAKFGTIPRRNGSHNFHDRHQATNIPLYYEQEDRGRESSYWTMPGSRTAAALQEYTTWTDPELCGPASSHFPFHLDRHTQQQHQDTGVYQPHEARDREWTAAQQTAREYERGFMREAWQRRWDPCSPIRYHRDVSSKRSDSSYRELEAWAARYSHSLPRRRRIEAELRGASQGLLESSRAPERDSRSGADVRVAALQQFRQSANIGGSGMWDRRDQLQTLTHYPPQAPACDTSQMLGIKEKTSYQRRMLSQPPGYIAPPPYSSQHKSPLVMQHCDTRWEQEGKTQTYWSQPTLRKQDVSVELQYKRIRDKEDCRKPDGHREETDNSQAGSPVSVQDRPMQHESTLSSQQLQTPSKIIEGRKFRVNKKTGGMTIFCLVSRIAGVTETPSLPLCISQTNIQDADARGDSRGIQDSNNQTNLADEVDFRAPTLIEQSDASNVTNCEATEKDTSTSLENDKEETGNVSPEKTELTDETSEFKRQSTQTMSVKYPLWREPSLTSRAETGATSTCLEGESEGPHNQEECVMVHPFNAEVRRVDVTQSEDREGLLVIDTSCVVAKMELIPSPKKEHVHYLGYTAEDKHSEPNIHSIASPESSDQDVTTEQNTKTKCLQMNLCSDLLERRVPRSETEISSPFIPTPSVSETLEERAQRILGIPLDHYVTEQEPLEATSLLDSHVEEAEPSSVTNYLHDTVGQIPEDTTDHLEVGQTEETDDAKDQGTSEDSQDLAGLPEEAFTKFGENDNDSQIETVETKITEDTRLESLSEDGKPEQSQGQNQYETPSLQFKPPKDISKSLLSDADLAALLCTSDSNEEHFDSELAALDTAESVAPHPENSSLPFAPLEQLPSPLPLEPTESSPTSTAHTDPSQSPPPSSPLDINDQNAGATMCSEDQGEISQIMENEINSMEDIAIATTEELLTEQQSVNDQADDPDCVEQSTITEADPLDLLEQTKPTLEILVDNILQLQYKCVKADDDACVQENCTTEEETEKGVKRPEMTISQDSQSVTEANVLQKHDGNDEEEGASCVKKSSMTEEPSIRIDDHAGQIISQRNTTDSHAPRDFMQNIKPHAEASGLECEMSELPLNVLVPSELPAPPDMSHCPPPCLDADGSPKTVPPLPYLDSIEESLHFSSYFPSESAPLISSSGTTYQKGGLPDLPDKETSQYPKSLWDAVNRIRKHTAPDSENEEEEVSEVWDPENLGERLGVQDVAVDLHSSKMAFDEAEQCLIVRSVEDVERDPCQAEEDALSCSSTSTHSSGDTVIVAEEDELEEVILQEETEDKMGTDKEFQLVQSVTSAGELTDKDGGEDDEEGQRDTQEMFSLSEACSEPEPELKDTEGIFTPPDVAVVSDKIKESGHE